MNEEKAESIGELFRQSRMDDGFDDGHQEHTTLTESLNSKSSECSQIIIIIIILQQARNF